MQFFNPFWEAFIISFDQILDKLLVRFARYFPKYKNVDETDFMSKLESDMRVCLAELKILSGGSNDTVAKILSWIVCCDECRHLNHIFLGCRWSVITHFNRASRLLPKGAVFLFMDTLADINLLDPRVAFPSDRMIAEGMSQYVLTDILSNDAHLHRVPRNIDESVKYEFMCQYGKPVWWPYWSQHLNPDAMQSFALLKIFALTKINEASIAAMSDAQALALLGVRMVFDFKTGFALSNKLVGSHGAHIEHFDSTYSRLHLTFLSDPVFAEASKRHLHDYNDTVWDVAMGKLLKIFCSRELDVGIKGELVGQCVCLKAMDDSSILTVEELLRKIVGPKYWSTLARVLDLEKPIFKGKVNPNHFTQLDYTPSREDLACLAERRGAVVCKKGQKGIDLIIPVVLPKKKRYGTQYPAPAMTKPCFSRQLEEPSVVQITRYEEPSAGRIVHADLIDALHNFARPSPVLSTLDLETEDEESLMKKARLEEDYVISAESMSYIIIQCKNHAKGSSHVLKNFSPVKAGIEAEGMSHSDLPSFLGIGMFFDRSSNECRVETLDVAQEIKSSEGSYLKLVNIHKMTRLSQTLGEILNVSANKIDVYRTKGEQIDKAIGVYPKYGMDMDECRSTSWTSYSQSL